MKYCARCGAVQPVANFGNNRTTRDGLTSYCRPCHNEAGKETYTRLYGSTREYHLRRRYGITGAEVEAMIAAQGGMCAVCPSKPEHVDHDHETGAVRGILCSNCNQALGNARDKADVLRGLASYLDRHGSGSLRLVVDLFPREDSGIEAALRRHLA